MNDASRTQGWAICIGALVLGFFFVVGVLSGSYVALAIPVTVLTLFVLGLAAWVGYTIATIHVEPEPVDEPASPSASGSAPPPPSSAESTTETPPAPPPPSSQS